MYACVLVSNVDRPRICCTSHVSILISLSSIRIFILSFLSFPFPWKISFAHVHEILISIFAIDLLDQNLTSFYVPK